MPNVRHIEDSGESAVEVEKESGEQPLIDMAVLLSAKRLDAVRTFTAAILLKITVGRRTEVTR